MDEDQRYVLEVEKQIKKHKMKKQLQEVGIVLGAVAVVAAVIVVFALVRNKTVCDEVAPYINSALGESGVGGDYYVYGVNPLKLRIDSFETLGKREKVAVFDSLSKLDSFTTSNGVVVSFAISDIIIKGSYETWRGVDKQKSDSMGHVGFKFYIVEDESDYHLYMHNNGVADDSYDYKKYSSSAPSSSSSSSHSSSGSTSKKTCSYCNGTGKQTVVFYSEGDWGEKTYSSYKCTYCNGTGKR